MGQRPVADRLGLDQDLGEGPTVCATAQRLTMDIAIGGVKTDIPDYMTLVEGAIRGVKHDFGCSIALNQARLARSE